MRQSCLLTLLVNLLLQVSGNEKSLRLTYVLYAMVSELDTPHALDDGLIRVRSLIAVGGLQVQEKEGEKGRL